MISSQVYTLSNKKVMIVLPPERRVKQAPCEKAQRGMARADITMKTLASSLMLSSVLQIEGNILPNSIIRTEIPAQQLMLKNIILLSASLASSSLPAPRSWPTIMEMLPPSCRQTMLNRLLMVEEMFWAATTSSPRTAQHCEITAMPLAQSISLTIKGVPFLRMSFKIFPGIPNPL